MMLRPSTMKEEAMPTIHEFERWMSAGQAAEEVGVSRQAIWKAANEKRLRVANTANGILVDPVSVEAMVRRRAVSPPRTGVAR
jgi:predicted DNA-binding protein (UPF0251 family)